MRRVTEIVVCLAIVLAVGACSSDSGSDGDASGGSARSTTTTKAGSATTAEPKVTTTTEDPIAKLPEPGSYEAAIAAVAGTDATTVPLTEEQALCVAPKWVAVAGADRLESNGVTPAMLQDSIDASFAKLGMTDEDGDALASALVECDVDLVKLYVESNAVRDLGKETKACVEKEASEEFVRRLIIVTMTRGGDAIGDDPPLVEQVTALFQRCPGLLDGG